MFAEFERRGVDYCLVGGLAVVAQCLAHGGDVFRATVDADAMVPQDYSNTEFARDYLRVYATDPKYADAIYEAVLGKGGFERLSEAENAFVNISFVGADEDLDGIDTPDFDVCRTLNGRTLASIDRERIELLGQTIWVATVDELLGMKRDTISIYGVSASDSPRPQDFVDVGILGALANVDAREEGADSGILAHIRRIFGSR